jgi:hypothetical protein
MSDRADWSTITLAAGLYEHLAEEFSVPPKFGFPPPMKLKQG